MAPSPREARVGSSCTAGGAEGQEHHGGVA
jgi:hypothetical protein